MLLPTVSLSVFHKRHPAFQAPISGGSIGSRLGGTYPCSSGPSGGERKPQKVPEKPLRGPPRLQNFARTPGPLPVSPGETAGLVGLG